MSASAWAYSNGEIVPLEQARYWPNDLAIIYGEIVYEATRTFGGSRSSCGSTSTGCTAR